MELTGTLLITIALCVASAVAYAAAAVWQQRLAHRSMGSLAGTGAWWATLALNGVGAVLHVFALRYGPLSLVQPFGILTLVLAVPFAAATQRRRVTHAERRGMAASGVGLLGILLLTGAGGGAAALTTTQLVSVLSTTAVALAILAIRGAVPGVSGLWAAAAAGIAFGVSSAMSQTVAVRLGAEGVAALAHPSSVLAALAIGALTASGLVFAQRSYRSGLGAPLAVSTLTNPAAATLIGILLLDEQITAGTPGALLALTCAACATYGITLLTPTPAPAASILDLPGGISDIRTLQVQDRREIRAGQEAPSARRGTTFAGAAPALSDSSASTILSAGIGLQK